MLIFWSAEHLRASLPVLVRGAPADGKLRLNVDLSKLATLRGILIDPFGTEHIVLRAGYHTLTLRAHGMTVLEGPVNLTFLVEGIEGVADAARLLRLARTLLDPTQISKLNANRRAPWYRKLREALLALDLYQTGVSQREVAAVMFGKSRADEAWQKGDTSLKQQVHRAVSKGRALADGQYLTLLRWLDPS